MIRTIMMYIEILNNNSVLYKSEENYIYKII